MFEKVFLEGNDKIQQKLERHMSSREDRIYLYADANDLERHWWCKEKKKKVDTKSLKRKANQRFRVRLKEFDFYWTVDSIHTSWGKIENISKDPLFMSSVKTNYGFVNTVEENPAQEISNAIFDSCIFKLKIKVRAIIGKIIHCSFILIMSLSNDLKWNSTFLLFNSSSLYQLFNSSISAKF